MKKSHRRLLFVLVLLGATAGAVALVTAALQDNLAFFITPSEILALEELPERNLRIGGVVEEGSVQRIGEGITVAFRVTDGAASVDVQYEGILPDLFREGQGVVAQGRLSAEGTFQANTVLAKHDETYMAPEAAEAMARAKQQVQEAQQGDY